MGIPEGGTIHKELGYEVWVESGNKLELSLVGTIWNRNGTWLRQSIQVLLVRSVMAKCHFLLLKTPNSAQQT